MLVVPRQRRFGVSYFVMLAVVMAAAVSPADANVRIVGAVKHAPDDGVGAVVIVPSPLSASGWASVTIATKGADRGRLGRCWACE